jgi:hypothetical protein
VPTTHFTRPMYINALTVAHIALTDPTMPTSSSSALSPSIDDSMSPSTTARDVAALHESAAFACAGACLAIGIRYAGSGKWFVLYTKNSLLSRLSHR